MKHKFLPILLAAAAMGASARAELLIYEGFDPAGGGDIQSGDLAGATSKGFAADSKWNTVGSDDFVAEFTSDGLTMNGLAATGGAVRVGVGGSSVASGVNVFRQSGVAAAPGQTIYGSFLFQNNQNASRYLTGFGVESGEDLPAADGSQAGPHRLADNDTAMHFCVMPDSFARDEEGVPGRASQGVKVGKYATPGSKDIAGAEEDLPNGETFLVVWSVTNPAGPGASSNGQQVVMWVLSQANLDAIRAAGEATEAAVDGNHTVRVVAERGLLARLLNTDFLNIFATTGGGKRESSSVYDEIRVGTEMASVLPKP
jgi:hypothetical protein